MTTRRVTDQYELERAGKPKAIQGSDGSVSISIPVCFKRRAGRKLVTLPDGEHVTARPWDSSATPIQMALARGWQWLGMLERGEVSSLKEIAAREKLDNSYVSRMVNLTSLAPDIVDAILHERLPPTLTLFELAVDTPLLWEQQRRKFIATRPE
jgi:hypothetical protein